MESTLTFTVRPEVEQIANEQHISVEAVMNEAVTTYLQTYAERKLRERLQQDYQALAEMWPELKAELDDEKWLAVENEALAKFEQSIEG
jgi:hypothetical protein